MLSARDFRIGFRKRASAVRAWLVGKLTKIWSSILCATLNNNQVRFANLEENIHFKRPTPEFVLLLSSHKTVALDNDNDNDNDTLREVPHPSNEGLALQARVSGPWSHKKESVLLVKLARWQSAQVQTVKRQNVVQRYLK